MRYKNKKFKKSKNWNFSKGVNQRFSSKNGHLSNFSFLGNIGQEYVFYDILERKNAFPGYKIKKLKKSKNWHFSKWVNPLIWVQKCPFFKLFFLRTIGQENVFYYILEGQNAFLGYKNNKFKKWKNWNFSKGVNPWFWSENCHFFNFFFRQYKPRICLLWYSRAKERLSWL